MIKYDYKYYEIQYNAILQCLPPLSADCLHFQPFSTLGDHDAFIPGPRVVRRLAMVEKLQCWITINFELFRCLVSGTVYLQLQLKHILKHPPQC